MFKRSHCLAAIAAMLLVSNAMAQTFVEVEPNNGKSEATLVTGIVAGDTISGTTTGADLTLGSTLDVTWDYYRVKVAPLPLGIYKCRLTQSASDTGHLGRIRALTQTGTVGVGGIAGTTDDYIQSTTVATPLLFNQWYGFGKQEEVYWANSGGITTTGAYTATFSATPIVPTPITPTFESANPITIKGTASFDTHVHLYDANLDPLPNGSNDDAFPALPVSGLACRLTRTLAPGTYYIAFSRTTAAWSQPAAFDDSYVTGPLMDFPNCIARSLTGTAAAQLCSFEISGSNGAYAVSNTIPGGTYYEVTWWQFSVVNGAPPVVTANDACANATDVGTGGINSGSFLNATNDGLASCDLGGASSRDVWYKITNPSAVQRTLYADTCPSTTDTVLALFDVCGGTELACNDDCSGIPCGGTTSCVSLVMNPGQTVRIRVSDKGIGVGQPYTLETWLLYANDECTAPIVLAGPGTYPFDTDGATTGSQGQICQAIDKDLWYTYTGTTNGTATITTCGLVTSPSTDTMIGVYDGAGCPVFTAIACADDDNALCTMSALETTLSWPTVCGQDYTIQLGGYSPTSDLLGTFTITEVGSNCDTPFTALCYGDGTDTACPCTNPGLAGRGCENTFGTGGASLSSTGIASISNDTLVLSGANTGPFQFGLYFEGSATANPTAPFAVGFGNGLRCVSFAGANRLQIRQADGVGSSATTVALSIPGFAVAGTTYYYQLWYRDGVPPVTIGSCVTAGFNFSHAISLTWGF